MCHERVVFVAYSKPKSKPTNGRHVSKCWPFVVKLAYLLWTKNVVHSNYSMIIVVSFVKRQTRRNRFSSRDFLSHLTIFVNSKILLLYVVAEIFIWEKSITDSHINIIVFSSSVRVLHITWHITHGYYRKTWTRVQVSTESVNAIEYIYPNSVIIIICEKTTKYKCRPSYIDILRTTTEIVIIENRRRRHCLR